MTYIEIPMTGKLIGHEVAARITQAKEQFGSCNFARYVTRTDDMMYGRCRLYYEHYLGKPLPYLGDEYFWFATALGPGWAIFATALDPVYDVEDALTICIKDELEAVKYRLMMT